MKDISTTDEDICEEQYELWARSYVHNRISNEDIIMMYVQTGLYIVIQTNRCNVVFVKSNSDDDYVMEYQGETGKTLHRTYFEKDQSQQVYDEALSHLGKTFDEIERGWLDDHILLMKSFVHVHDDKQQKIIIKFEHLDTLFMKKNIVEVECRTIVVL
jgi:hypothetical protein